MSDGVLVSMNSRPHVTPSPHLSSPHSMEASAFLQPLKPYLAAFVEHGLERRLGLLEEALASDAEIWGPTRVFTGYAEISDKIVGFHQNWPDCRLILSSGLITFRNTAHFAMVIIGSDGLVHATGHSVVELALDRRIQRILAFWGTHPQLPEFWPRQLSANVSAGSQSVA